MCLTLAGNNGITVCTLMRRKKNGTHSEIAEALCYLVKHLIFGSVTSLKKKN